MADGLQRTQAHESGGRRALERLQGFIAEADAAGRDEQSALFENSLAVRVCASQEKKIPHDLAVSMARNHD
ncbi:MAG: hypothetical protein JXR96_17640 [Deltaproteobacteria bacterium]|nr:hypothetical protein [Deltaproteobacteria bacterium]